MKKVRVAIIDHKGIVFDTQDFRIDDSHYKKEILLTIDDKAYHFDNNGNLTPISGYKKDDEI